MTVDLTKVILHTSYDAFKNAAVYRGSLVLPTSIPVATPANPFTQTSISFTLAQTPTFTTFWAFFNELGDSLSSINNPQWYNASVAGALGIGYPAVGTSSPSVGVTMYPIINGTNVTIIAQGQNTTGATVSANIIVPFAFVDYTLAN